MVCPPPLEGFTYLSSHLLSNFAREAPHDRDKVHLDESHGASEALLEPDDVDLGILEVALS